MDIWHVLRADHSPAAQNLHLEFIHSLQQREFSAILADASPDAMMPLKVPYFSNINHTASVACPAEQKTMPPLEQMLFFTSPQTPDMKSSVLFVPQNP